MTDSELPTGMKYSNLLPLGEIAREEERVYYPNNGSTFKPNNNNKIIIPINAMGFLDGKHSFLRFKFTNKNNKAVVFTNAHCCFQQVLVRSGTQILSQTDQYHIVATAMMGMTQPHQTAGYEGQALNGSGPINAAWQGGQSIGAAGAAVPAIQDNRTYSLSLIDGILNSERYTPLLAMRNSQGLVLELTLNPQSAFLSNHTDDAALNADYELTDVEYHASIIEFGARFNEVFLQGVQQSGLTYHCVCFQDSVSSGPSGAGVAPSTINFNHKYRSLKSLFAVQVEPTPTGSANAWAGGNTPPPVPAVGASAGMAGKIINNGVKSYRYNIGGVNYPPQYVVVNERGTPLIAVGSAVQEGSQGGDSCLAEAHKAFVSLGNRNFSGTSTQESWGNNPGGQGANAADQAADARVGLSCGNNARAMSFTAYSVDTEAYAQDSSLLECGLDTASSGLSLDLQLNWQTGGATNQSIFHCIAMFDALVSITPELVAVVSY